MTSRLPTISVAARPSLGFRSNAPHRIAAAAGLDKICLDLSTILSKQLLFRQGAPADPVTTVWLGNPWVGLWSGPSDVRRLSQSVRQLNPAAVAFDLECPANSLPAPVVVIQRMRQAHLLAGQQRRLLLAIRAPQLLGGRRHLADLTALRHLAEEWDLGIALDLVGNLDPTWEAEAAIVRLGNQLRLLRISTEATDRLAVGRSRVVARALGAALDLSVPPEIALLPTVPLIRAASARARAESTARAVAAIRARVARVSTQRAQFLNQDLWPNLRG